MASTICRKHVRDVCKLARYLMEYESFILHRRCRLSLTTSVLSVINSSLEHLQKPEEMWEWDPGIDYNHVEYLQALNFFVDFFHRVRDVQVSLDYRQPVDLSRFHNIHCLELRNIAYDLVVGIEAIQNRLQEFISHHCDISVHDFLSFNPSGMDSVCLWTSLQKLSIVKCRVKDLQGALRKIPSLKYLDLSYNCLSNVAEIKFLINLEYLNLSYNSLTSIPPFNVHAHCTLKTFLIRNNKLENLQGIQQLSNLHELDLRYNCLVYRTMLEPLFSLQKLQSLWLDGNPLSLVNDYRCCAAQVLNYNLLHTNFFLDGVHLSKKEIHKVQTKSKRSINNVNASKAIINAVAEENVACSNSLAPSLSSDVRSEGSIGTLSSKPSKERSESKTNRKTKTKKSEKRPREAVIIDKTAPLTSEDRTTSALNPISSAVQETTPMETLSPTKIISTTNGGSNPVSPMSEPPCEDPLDPAKKNSLLIKDPFLEAGDVKHDIKHDFILGKYSEDSSDACNAPIAAVESKPTESCDNDLNEVKRDTHDGQITKVNEKSIENNDVIDDDDADDDSETKVLLDFGELSNSLNPITIEPPSPIYQDEPLKYTLHEDVPEERLFLAQQYVNEELHDVMLIVGEKHIQEIDGLTGRVKDVLDLKTLTSFTHSVTNLDLLEVHLYFDPARRRRLEKIYILDSHESMQNLEAFLKPFTEVSTDPTLQCLKCSMHLTKYDVKRTVFQSWQSTDQESSAEDLEFARSEVTEVEVCPKCGSTAIVNLEANDESMEGEANTGSLENSCEKSTSTVVEKKLESLISIALGQAEDDYESETFEVRRLYGREVDSISVGSNENFMSGAHTLGVHESRKISGSDITILSNPSQSSIVRIPETGMEMPDSALGIILESPVSLSLPTFCDNGSSSQRGLDNIYDQDVMKPSNTDHSSLLSESSIETLLNSQEMLSLSQEKKTKSYLSHSGSKAPNSPKLLLQNRTDSQISPDPEKSSMEIWNELSKARKLTYENFVLIDHRLRLHLEMNIFGESEEFEGMIKAGMLVPPFQEEQEGFLVLSTKKAYSLRATGDPLSKQNDEPSSWLQFISARNLDQLKRIIILLGNQGFWLEWEKESLANSSKLCQLFLVKDADQCNCFVSFLTDLLAKRSKSNRGSEVVEVIAEEDPSELIKDVILWCPPGQTFEVASCEILVYQLVKWQQVAPPVQGQAESDIRSITAGCIITSTDIYIATLQPQVPVLKPLRTKNSRNTKQSYSPLSRQSISYLMSVHLRSDLKQVGMHFMDYKEQDEILWLITTESSCGIASLLNTLKAPWESCFHIPLELKIVSGCECGI